MIRLVAYEEVMMLKITFCGRVRSDFFGLEKDGRWRFVVGGGRESVEGLFFGDLRSKERKRVV
jgi:hypothetical protein